MINIYTDERCITDDSFVVRDFESFFLPRVSSSDFEEIDLLVLEKVDSAVILDINLGTIRTKFGVTSIQYLSTGCKTVLSYLYLKRQNLQNLVLNVSECGWNALDCLFECMENMNDEDTKVVLEHDNYLFKCGSRDYLINDEYHVSDLSLLSTYR